MFKMFLEVLSFWVLTFFMTWLTFVAEHSRPSFKFHSIYHHRLGLPVLLSDGGPQIQGLGSLMLGQIPLELSVSEPIAAFTVSREEISPI